MSAIAGIITSSTDDLRFISAMTDMLGHRGAQADGILWMQEDGTTRISRDSLPSTVLIPGRAALGHRQLASFGEPVPQPLASADSRYWLAYDGTIYNYRELRSTMEAHGHRFTTHSDAETVLAAYTLYGRDCFQKFNGPFALAILDTQERTLLLARDSLGIRPVYFWAHRGRLAFASEIKALFAIPEIRPKLERQTIGEFIRFGGVLSEQKTMFAHIQPLPPGTSVVIPLDTPNVVKPVPFNAPIAPGESYDDTAAARFRDLFFASVERQRSSPLEIGTCLTGGLDSTAIACVLRQQLGDGAMLNSFTAIFEQPGYDERTWVTAANSAAHTLSNLVAPMPEDFMAELDTLLWHQDEPFAHVGTYAQWCVARAAREAKVSVILDGHGADEHVGLAPLPSLMQRLLPRHSREESRALAKLAPSVTGVGQADRLSRALHCGDRNAMAFGVELRMPYLDQPLIAFARNLPGGLKQGKQLMRRALADILPEPIITRSPSPAFHVPLVEWMQGTILPAFLRDIKHARLPLAPIVHGGELREIVTRQVEHPDAALAPLLFRLFIANRWMLRFNVAPVI